jgi:hypothetical protein
MLWHILRVSLSTSRQWSSGSFWSSASSDSNVHHGSPHCHVQKSPLRNGRFRVSQLGSCRLANALARKAPGESRDGHRKMKMGKCSAWKLYSVFSDRKTSLVKAFHVCQIQGAANTSDQHRSNWKKLPGQEMPAVGPHESKMACGFVTLFFCSSIHSCSMHQCLQT